MQLPLRFIIVTLLLLSGPRIASAQEAKPKAPEKEATGSMMTPPLRALAVGIFQDMKTLDILDAERQSVGQLNLRLRSYSQPFRCPIIKGHLVFGVEDGVDEFGKPKYKPVTSVKWNSSYKQMCFVFIPQDYQQQSTSKLPYKIMAMDMSLNKFKLGHTKVANFTPVQILFRIGEHKKMVESGQLADIPKVTELKKMNMAQVDVFYSYDGKTSTILQTRKRYLERVRYFAVVYPDFKNKQIRVAMVKDYGTLF